MGFAEDYVEKRIADLELYLRYCRHSMKRRKMQASLNMFYKLRDEWKEQSHEHPKP